MMKECSPPAKRIKVEMFKIYNKGAGDVDLIGQSALAYHQDQKLTIRFYLLIFFNLVDVACAYSYIAYNMMHPNDFPLLDFKTIVSTYLTES